MVFLLKKFNKRAQSSIEFVILISFMILIFTGFSLIIQSRIVDVSKVRNRIYADQVKDIVFNELSIAETMPVNYSHYFFMPTYINDNPYSITIFDGKELVINYNDQEFVYFLRFDIDNESTIKKGKNIIKKTKEININYKIN